MDNKSFNRALSAFIGSQKTQRDKLQALLVAGFEQVEESGNTIYLTRALEACINVKSLPTKSIKDYVKAHIENVGWLKDKTGKPVFKKVSTKQPLVVTMPTEAWYNHETAKSSQAKPDMDVLARAKSLLTAINKAVEAGTIKEGQADKATELRAALAELTA